MTRKLSYEHLILVDKLSYEEIGRRYGCSGANIKNVARRLGIELPIKRKINPKETFNRKYCLNCGAELISYNGSYGKYCCPKCQFEHAHMLAYKKLLDGDESIMRANYSPKAFKKDILKEQGNDTKIVSFKLIKDLDKKNKENYDMIVGYNSDNSIKIASRLALSLTGLIISGGSVTCKGCTQGCNPRSFGNDWECTSCTWNGNCEKTVTVSTP